MSFSQAFLGFCRVLNVPVPTNQISSEISYPAGYWSEGDPDFVEEDGEEGGDDRVIQPPDPEQDS